jgi:hypothetical protein
MVVFRELHGRPHVRKMLEVSHADPSDIRAGEHFRKLVKSLKEIGLTSATLDEFEEQVRRRYAVSE